jgi:hypothetical protein
MSLPSCDAITMERKNRLGTIEVKEKPRLGTNPESKNIAKLNNNLFENFKKFQRKISTNFKNAINTHNKSNNFSTTNSLRTYSNYTNTSPGNKSTKESDKFSKKISFWKSSLKKERNELLKANDIYENTQKLDGFSTHKVNDKSKEKDYNRKGTHFETLNSAESIIKI